MRMTTRPGTDPSGGFRSRRQELGWLVPAAIVAVVASLGANREVAGDAAADAAALRVAAGAVPAAAALLVAVRAPRPAVVLNGLGVGGYFAAGLVDGPILLTLPLVAFVAARRARPRALLPWLGVAVCAVMTGLVLRAVRTETTGWMAVWQGTGIGTAALAAALLGWWVAGRGEVRAERARRAAAEERLRMAQDLHDGVGHGLAVIAMQAGVALHLLDREAGGEGETDGRPGQVRRSLEVIRAASTEALDELRIGLARLTPAHAGTAGGGADRAGYGPRRGLADLGTLLERVRSGGTRVELDCRSPWLLTAPEAGEARGETGVDPVVDATAYAVVQESLTNVLRHSGAVRAEVELRLRDGALVVTVRDDGGVAGGAVPGTTGSGVTVPGETAPGPGGGRGRGQGIAGMRSRVGRLGGSVEAGPADGGGWQVRAVLPVPDGQPEGPSGPGATGTAGPGTTDTGTERG